MSKKILAGSVAILLMVVMVACGGGNKAVGEWVGSSVSAAEGISEEELAMVNSMLDLSGFTLSMKKDNTFVMAMDMGGTSDSVSGTWKEENGQYTLESPEQTSTLSMKLEGNELILDMVEVYIHFKKA